MAHKAFRCWVHDRHHWDVRVEGKLAGADGGAGATLFRGEATATELYHEHHPSAAVGTIRLCVIKHNEKSEDPDMEQEKRVLENLLAKGTPIRTGAGCDYYLGCRSTDDDGIRLFLSFAEDDLDLAQKWGIKTEVSTMSRVDVVSLHDVVVNARTSLVAIARRADFTSPPAAAPQRGGTPKSFATRSRLHWRFGSASASWRR